VAAPASNAALRLQEQLGRAVEAADQTEQHLFDAELNRIGGEIALRSDRRKILS
jgi:hypothetical protein